MMSTHKPAESESSWPTVVENPPVLPGSDDDDTNSVGAEHWQRIRHMVGRAAFVYLVLFLALGLVMSLVGANPLANNGLMPKILLVFVGLALLIALANTLIDLSREQGRNWLRLVRGRGRGI